MPPYQILVLSSGVGPWWSLLPNIRCLWRHYMTSYSRLQTNILAKFVDIPCIQGRWSSGKAGAAVKELRAMETFQKQKNRYQVCLFLFINHVDLKNNNRNYRKLFWIIWGPNSCNIYFKSILMNHEITYDTVVKRHLRTRCTPIERAEEEMLPPSLHSPASLCILFYTRGSQPGVHVPPGVHLPIRRGTFKVINRRAKCICI